MGRVAVVRVSRVVQLLPRAPGGFYSHNSFGVRRARRRHVDDEYAWLDGIKAMFVALCLIALVAAVSALIVGTAYVTLWLLSHTLGGIAP